MKKQDALNKIGAMSGIVSVQKIINILLSIDNFNQDTLNKLTPAIPYTEKDCTPLSEIYVDLSYQRKLRIQAIINRLLAAGKFDKEVAGHIDIAIRTDNRKFVWDGFHRCIKAGLARLTEIPSSDYVHDKSLNDHQQRMKEARMFKVRNADQTKMEPGEIFKSEVVFQDSTALQILDLMKRSKVNVEGTNSDEDAYDLGGFSQFRKVWNQIDSRYWIDASDIIRHAWPNQKNMSVILWCGLTKLLEANHHDSGVKSAGHTELKETFVNMVKDNKYLSKDFTQPRLHGKAIESTARNILRLGLCECYNDNGKEVKSLITYLDIDEDDFDDTI